MKAPLSTPFLQTKEQKTEAQIREEVGTLLIIPTRALRAHRVDEPNDNWVRAGA